MVTIWFSEQPSTLNLANAIYDMSPQKNMIGFSKQQLSSLLTTLIEIIIVIQQPPKIRVHS